MKISILSQKDSVEPNRLGPRTYTGTASEDRRTATTPKGVFGETKKRKIDRYVLRIQNRFGERVSEKFFASLGARLKNRDESAQCYTRDHRGECTATIVHGICSLKLPARTR